ncbi:hypothetical protein EJ06DRAFT_557434 [Trichodelitschia bisporula]|uniref:CST complex subunit Ten1 n=1 Tax=Trichodelitschia bisporula TaxID=703511 RepID=A0A6G1HV09_9PEZI|nr:hypothetical protein EJ06DRAFT_557434 [Trichodelitschia bisporula]
MSTPIPSKLIFLSDLPTHKARDKVRFLACVETYDPVLGLLHCTHAYPRASTPVIAHIQVNLVLESLTHALLQTGAWLNVIGYVAERPPGRNPYGGVRATRLPGARSVFVQAVVVWEAGEVAVAQYERALEGRKACAI